MIPLPLVLFLFAATQPARAYVGGEPGGDRYASAVAIFSAERCSGVKIAAHQILTAAHCVWPDGARPDPVKAPRVTIADGTFSSDYEVAQYKIHPSWAPDRFRDPKTRLWSDQKSEDAVDLAIVETVKEITGIPSAPISLRPVVVGDVIIVGGFGVGSPLAPREYGRPQIRELSVATKTVSAVLANSFVVPPSDSRNSRPHLSVANRGDSGGAAFRCSVNGACDVVGINSWVDDLANLVFPFTNADGSPDYTRFRLQGNQRADLHLKKLADGGHAPTDVLTWIKQNSPSTHFQ